VLDIVGKTGDECNIWWKWL